MTEFKVQLDDQVVQALGYKPIEQYLNKHIVRMILKMSSQDLLKDLKEVDLENDEQWKIAREEAWKTQAHKYEL
ncbi:hypothetical protein SAMN05216436_106129 [bacterium A37T11]|nr:hypothetical protein SAMN05216436_106129 [bacterium A37T11]